MSDQPNGPVPPPNPPQQPMTSEQRLDMMVNAWCWPVICNAVNGIRSSMPQVNVVPLMVRISALMGRVVGETLSIGMMADVLPLRGECIKAFSEALRGVKIQPPPAQPGQPMSRLNS